MRTKNFRALWLGIFLLGPAIDASAETIRDWTAAIVETAPSVTGPGAEAAARIYELSQSYDLSLNPEVMDPIIAAIQEQSLYPELTAEQFQDAKKGPAFLGAALQKRLDRSAQIIANHRSGGNSPAGFIADATDAEKLIAGSYPYDPNFQTLKSIQPQLEENKAKALAHAERMAFQLVEESKRDPGFTGRPVPPSAEMIARLDDRASPAAVPLAGYDAKNDALVRSVARIADHIREDPKLHPDFAPSLRRKAFELGTLGQEFLAARSPDERDQKGLAFVELAENTIIDYLTATRSNPILGPREKSAQEESIAILESRFLILLADFLRPSLPSAPPGRAS